MGINYREMAEKADQAFNKRDWKAFRDYHTKDVVVNQPMGEPTKGIEAHEQGIKALMGAFPDMKVELIRAFGDGDWMCTEEVITGTHKGPLPGPGGQVIPPTNKTFRMTLATVTRIRDGKAAEERVFFDMAGMMAQLGLMPE